MADTRTIEVPVKLKAEFQNINKDLQKVLKNIQDGLADVDPASGLAKSLTKAYAEIEKQLGKSSGLLDKEFFSEADMSKVTKAWDKVSDVLSSINSQTSRASLGTLGVDIEGLAEAKQQLQDIIKLRQAFLGRPVSADITPDALALANKHAGKSGFKETANYGKNLINMTTATATLTAQLETLEKQAQDTQEALDQATQSHAAAQDGLNIAQELQKTKGNFYNTQYGNVASTFAKAGAAANGNSPQNVIDAYKKTVASLISNGEGGFAENGELIARMVRDWFDLDIDFSKEASEIVADLQNGLEDALRKDSKNWGKRGKLSGKALQGAFNPFTQKAGKDNFAASKTSQELAEVVTKAQEEVNKTKAVIDDTGDGSLKATKAALDTQITEAKTVIKEIQASIEELKALRQERNTEAGIQFDSQQQQAQERVNRLTQQARESTHVFEEVRKGQSYVQSGTTSGDAYKTDRIANEQAQKNAQAAQEAANRDNEQFRQRLTQSIHQWTSVQQIVNKIKDGFRQAIQDIKGLDKAMTNIAVVTDMSVSDLWGKIDKYMSIAQQYGVTTQGVYEVSQLYYQQGLGTDEVMAATTETLKMARIAGMEYAEAADAMTVAIRAFKMEMSDAEHVTDVYSKVAAVTASDTEELAVAMSKTASSAESVGSSFENTTAMLAVMIETTRESAQNLGSALKSIISRYGEMKVGVTVDSEGETIDYNKVDTALKSVGISIKDAQGQFRDFDDVIFELSEKWDSLDKNTQRYIATIMAGNRQQSRFIALVDNWERLDEVAGAAQDSEDAGLLQYAKTLDSLESKVNNIKTSFQQFYMSVFNGPVWGGVLEFLNNLITGFNKLSKITTIFNVVSIISGIRIIGELVVNTFSEAFKNISTAWKATLKEMRLGASKEMRTAGAEASQAYKQGQQEGNTPSVKGGTAPISGRVAGWSAGLAAAGMVASTVGSFIAAKDQTAGAWVSGAGSGLSTAGLALSLTGNPLIAALAGVATAAVSIVTSVPSELEKAQEELAEAKEKAEKSNIERAEKKNEYETLKDGLANLKRLKESRYDSAEAEQEFITANNALLEQFPQLATAFEGAENAIIDLNEAENDLMRARVQASIAAKESADAEIARALKEQAVKKQQASDDETKLENSVKWQANPINKIEGRYGPSLLTANYKHVGGTAKTINWLTGATQGLFTQEELEKWGITALQSTGELTHASNQPASRGMAALQRGEQVVAIKQNEGYALQVLNTSLASASNKIDFTNPKAREWFAQAAQAPNMEQLLKALEVFSSEYLVDKTSAGEQDFIKKLTGGKYSSVSAMTAVTPTAEREVKFAGAALDNAIKAGIADYINSSTMFLGEENSFLTMSNSKRILQRNLEDSFAKYEKENPKVDPEELWKNWTEAADGYSAAYTHWSEQLDAAYKDLKSFSSLEEYNELDKNRGRYTADEYEKALDEFKSLIGEELYTFLTDSVDAAATQAQTDFSEAISSINKQDFVNFDIAGFTLPEEYYDEAVDYAKSLNAQVKGGRLHKDTAGQQWENYKKIWAEIDGLTDPNQKLAARQKVSQADLSSITSIRQLEADLAKSGITLGSDIWTSLIKNAAVNLVTEVETLQSSIATQLDASAKAIKNAYNGVDSAAEALKMANKFGVDLADLDVRNGKFYFEDAEAIKKATQKEWEQTVKDLLGNDSSWWQDEKSAFGRAYQDAGDISDYATLKAKQKELLDKQTQNAAAMTQDQLDQLALFNQYGDQYKEWASKQSPGTATSFRDFITYVRDTSDAALVTMQEKWQAQIEKEAAKQSTIDSFYGGEAERKKLSAQKSLASGGQGLSGDTIYEVLDAYGISHDQWAQHFTKNADGTFDIITNSGLFNQLDQATKNAIIDKVAANVDSAEQGLLKLGESAAAGKKLDAGEIRNLLGAEFDGLNDAQATLLYGRFKGYANGKITKNQLIDDIAIRLQDQAKSKGQTLSDEEAKKQAENYFNEIDAQLTEAIKKNFSKRLDIQAKVLQGTATETEKKALKDAGIDISGLESKTNKAIINWINSYLKNTDISFDDKVKYAKTAFSTALTNEFGEDIGTLGETAVKGVFGTQDAAADFISKYYTILGQTIDENTADSLVSSWFTRDDSGQYRLQKTIQSLRDELSKIQGSANQKEIDNLEAQLTYYENLQTMQRKEGLVSSLQSLITAKDISASQMISLFKDQGKTLTPEDAEKYAQVLESLNPIERLKQLKSYLNSAGVKIDSKEYADLAKDIITTTMQSAQDSINKLSSGMSWNEAFNLTKEIDGLGMDDFEIIDNQYFVKNTEQIAQFWKEQVAASFSEQKNALTTMGVNLGEVPIALLENGDLGSFADSPIADLSSKYNNVLALMNSESFNESHYQQWLSQAGNASKNFGQYWQEYIESLDDAAHAAIEAWKEEADKQLAIADRAAELKEEAKKTKGEKFLDQVEAKELIKSHGLSGYGREDIAKLEAAGYLTEGQATLQDDGTYTIPKDILTAVDDISVGNAINIKLTSEVESAKTAADNLAKNILSGTATLENYTALFGDKYTSDVGEALERYLTGSAQVGDEEKLKGALEIKDRTEADVTALLSQLGVSYADYKHELARSIFDTKIEALSSGYLSEASKETLKKGGASDFVTKFAGLAGKAADKIFDTVYEEYEKAYTDGVIKRDEYRTGIAEAASKAFTAKVEAKKPSLYLDNATKEIAGGDALYDADALGSLYAAIADKQKAAKESVLTFDEFYNQYVTGITEAGEAILNVKALKGANLISNRRYKEFSSALMDNLFSSAEEIITQMETGDTEGLGLQIQQMFDALGMSLSDTDAAAILNGGKDVLLNRLILEINRAGLDTSEVQSRLQELQALILDAITESISSGLSALGEGIEGTLSEASFLDLQNKYKFEDSSFRTSRGIQLSAQNRQDIISGLYGEAKANGRTAGFGEQLLEILNTEGSGFEGYKDIEEAIADANEQIANGVKGAEEYAEALMLARDAAYEMADAAEFAFMEQDGYDGKADTFDKFTENVTKAKEALATFKKGGKVAHADLTAMFDVIKNGSEESITKFETSLSKAGGNMEEILHSMLNFVDTTGKIDLSKWATKMGIDIKTATSAMSEGMSDALMATAKDQIKYLSGLEAMLKAMIALEEVGDIKLNFELDLDNDGKEESLYLKDVYQAWKLLDDTSDRKDLIVEIKAALGGNASLNAYLESMGIKGANFFELMFPNGIDPDDEFTFQTVAMLGQAMSAMKQLAPEQADTVGRGLLEAFGKSLNYDETTQKWSFGPGWQQSLRDYLETLDWSNVAYSASTEIAAQLAESGQDGFIIDGVKVTMKNGKYYIPEGSNLTEEGVTKELEKQFGITGGKAIKGPTIEGETEIDFVQDPAAQTKTEALKTEFTSISEAATGVSDAITSLTDLLNNFQVSDAFREFVNLMTQLVTGSASVTKTVEGAQNAANMEKVAGEGEGDGENERTITLNIDITAAELAFKTIEEYYTKLAQLVSTPISVDLNSVTATTSQALTNQGGNVPPATNPGGGVVSPLTTHTVQIVWDITEPDFDSIQAPTLDFKWMKKSPPTPSYNPTINYKWGSATNKITYSGAAIEVPIKLVEQTTQQAWTGTMNNIAGAAFADGSISNLYSGASFASKTLVGELGPELAVYDGQYHLLGQHGAEFVNLPKDAIVFNHKQTAGIAKGQFNIRGKAMAEGNITGPAMAGGAAAALAAVQRAKSLWQGLLDNLTAAELAGGANGGGGGGNTLKGVKQELQEWYNLSRKIADIEQEINNILAERENIPREDGDAYLRSLREQQNLLQEQAATQEILLGYQKLQLERQAEHINNNAIWSQFLMVDENGLLQYTKGNELFGGKGALEVLSNLNEMSGAEQLEFLQSLGYTAYDQDGKALEGTELIQKFFEELQYQIDEYDQLYDTIHSTSEELQKLQTEIDKINNEITQNQMDLEEDIYNILVDAWEKEIEALEEQKELIEEANDAYVKGLNEALSAEREMYSEEQSIANREQLQRQLSLLRRSGGSASEIANLEKQLDGMLQEEYFRNQEKMIQSIEDANKKQVEQLEHQIRLQEEALEFEKEHGVLWTKVYEVMAGSKDEILAFMQNNYPGFFSQSVLEQRKMLTDWAHEIGIYTENRTFEEHKTYAQSNIWDTGAIWAQGNMGGYQSMFNALAPEQQAAAREQFNTTYASARLAGDDHETAMRKANASLTKYLTASKEQQEAEKNKEPNTDKVTNPSPSTPPASTPTYSTVSISVSANPSAGGSPTVSKTKANAGDTITVYPKPKEGYAFSHITVGGNQKSGTTFQVTGQISSVKVVVYYTETSKTEEEAKTGDAGTSSLTDKGVSKDISTKAFSSGGLVDYTGPAIVHGSPSKPEAFLNAKQTAIISEAVKFAGDGGALDGIKATLNALNASIKSIVNNNRNEISSFTVAPGAVTIQVAELSDSYDVEELSRDVMNRMVAIASKSTNRGVSRR